MDEKELLKQLACDVKLSLTDEQMEYLCEKYHAFLQQIKNLENIQTEGVEPLVFPYEIETTFLRDDDNIEVNQVDDILKNAKKVEKQQIVLPKVISS